MTDAEDLKNKKPVSLYTDGACKGNPGPGGWGVYLKNESKELRLSGGSPKTTNQEMELRAVIEGFKALKRPCHVQVISDSQLVIKGMTEWLAGWQARGWKTASKKPVTHKDLWLELVGLAAGHHVVWQWVGSHGDDLGNVEADRLANLGCAGGK